MVHLLRFSSVKWFVSSSVSSFSWCNSLSCPSPTPPRQQKDSPGYLAHYPGKLAPTPHSAPPPPPPPPPTPLRITSQTQFKTIFIFYNKFITLNYQNSTYVCFFIIFFSFCIKFCQVFWVGGGGQAPQARVSSPPGEGGKLPRVIKILRSKENVMRVQIFREQYTNM